MWACALHILPLNRILALHSLPLDLWFFFGDGLLIFLVYLFFPILEISFDTSWQYIDPTAHIPRVHLKA
jgi:hypothetical protein